MSVAEGITEVTPLVGDEAVEEDRADDQDDEDYEDDQAEGTFGYHFEDRGAVEGSLGCMGV